MNTVILNGEEHIIRNSWTDKTGENHEYFEEEAALAVLLLNGKVHLNSNWWEKDWPEEARESLFAGVSCSDTFAWGISESETLHYSEIEEVYKYYEKDPIWGTDVWCMVKRNELPQKPVYDAIMKAGIWNLDDMNLLENYYDARCKEEYEKKNK